MNKEILYGDIKNRALKIYCYYQDLVKKNCPEKWYESKLIFEIKDDPEINGKSWCDNENDHVEINKGVIDIYYEYFCKVMEMQTHLLLAKFMPDKDQQEIEEMSYEAIVHKKDGIEIFDSKIVDDSKASMLEIFISRFILLHEFGHIFNGHCKYLAGSSTEKFDFMPMYFNEINEVKRNITALDIRTLEMDADAFAATQGFEHVLFLYRNFSAEVMIQNMNPVEVFYWWSFALRSHFLLCEDHFMDNNYDINMKHLPSSARWSLIWGTLDAILHRGQALGGLDTEQVYKELTKGAFDAERVFNDIKLTSYSWLNEIAENKKFRDYSIAVNRNWDILKSRIEGVSRLFLYEA